ncbi:hypothetical protein BCR34DRAFT_172398 [Clohesyomyces aquaticus]|uniref:Uncharacterized protein n=1 Tax=Clohesyomyces aquaticus TaxID=1231657 RepID=A0A1Y1YGI5_9PLEO|nr:hypothetical protein BCR34DRAFT_172398 [Clohesyomyces aquaticus]
MSCGGGFACCGLPVGPHLVRAPLARSDRLREEATDDQRDRGGRLSATDGATQQDTLKTFQGEPHKNSYRKRSQLAWTPWTQWSPCKANFQPQLSYHPSPRIERESDLGRFGGGDCGVVDICSAEDASVLAACGGYIDQEAVISCFAPAKASRRRPYRFQASMPLGGSLKALYLTGPPNLRPARAARN